MWFAAWITHFMQFLSKISHAYIESDSFEFKVICSNQIVCCFSISVDFQLGSALSCWFASRINHLMKLFNSDTIEIWKSYKTMVICLSDAHCDGDLPLGYARISKSNDIAMVIFNSDTHQNLTLHGDLRLGYSLQWWFAS